MVVIVDHIPCSNYKLVMQKCKLNPSNAECFHFSLCSVYELYWITGFQTLFFAATFNNMAAEAGVILLFKKKSNVVSK